MGKFKIGLYPECNKNHRAAIRNSNIKSFVLEIEDFEFTALMFIGPLGCISCYLK